MFDAVTHPVRIVERTYAGGSTSFVIQHRVFGCLWWVDAYGYVSHLKRYALSVYDTLAAARADIRWHVVDWPVDRVVADDEKDPA